MGDVDWGELVVGTSGKVDEDDAVGGWVTVPNEGEAALGEGVPFSTSTLVEPKLNAGEPAGVDPSSAS